MFGSDVWHKWKSTFKNLNNGDIILKKCIFRLHLTTFVRIKKIWEFHTYYYYVIKQVICK